MRLPSHPSVAPRLAWLWLAAALLFGLIEWLALTRSALADRLHRR